jgi:hypothetical protein
MSDSKSNSPAFSLNSVDVVSIAKNAALVAVAAGLTYLGENISDMDLGNAGIMIVPFATVVINTIVKWAKNNVTE